MYEYLLPIGSVVRLKGLEKKVMIFGFLQREIDNNNLFDYIGVPYPEGQQDARINLGFNHRDIEELIFKGYVDDEYRYLKGAIEVIDIKEINS